ncbi:MAG TPA: hypothetical protein VFA20_12045 [Myxococcaceae bacterium]|nr:hypothetical protein [Myxococcaceae bacterium]
MPTSIPPSRWIRNLVVLLAVVAAGGLVRAVRGDTGPGSQHNDPGPGNCAHTHAGFNTSYCTGNNGGDGASCTVNNKPGKCTTTRQQCYCVATDGGVVAVDGGVVKEPISEEPFGFGGAEESGSH